MDVSDMGVRHAVAFSNLNIKHTFELSPSTVSIAREIRISVIAIVIGIATVSILNSVLSLGRPAERGTEDKGN